jgi:hypothetical protein
VRLFYFNAFWYNFLIPRVLMTSHILSHLDFKESAQSGVHPRQNMPGTGVGNFWTFAAAHLP